MPNPDSARRVPYQWAAWGDVNAFFGLMLDNLAGLVLAVGLLSSTFAFPAKFCLYYMIPGTALGVLVGDLLFTGLAFYLARKTANPTVTAMPLGLDTPSTIGLLLFVVGPAFVVAKGSMTEAAAARYAWGVGASAIILSGIIKLAAAPFGDWVRAKAPRAGTLGSLAAVAMVLISFLPLTHVLENPIAGLLSLVIVLITLVARVQPPFRLPGALLALLVGGMCHILLMLIGLTPQPTIPPLPLAAAQTAWLEIFPFAWVSQFGIACGYLPIIIPFALGTVVGGIDCTESAEAAGDLYDTRVVLGVEALATLAAGFCGGVLQTTPYIGHPAYKAMGGRAGYTLATALFIGVLGLSGYFEMIYALLPAPVIFPILIFVGLEIASQSFHATPARHYPALGLACIPALASLVMIFVDPLLAGRDISSLPPPLNHNLITLRVLAGGFILTSLLWGSMLATIIDRRFKAAAVWLLICAAASAVGLIHSPFADGSLLLPWQTEKLSIAAKVVAPWRMALGYALSAALLFAWGSWGDATNAADQHA